MKKRSDQQDLPLPGFGDASGQPEPLREVHASSVPAVTSTEGAIEAVDFNETAEEVISEPDLDPDATSPIPEPGPDETTVEVHHATDGHAHAAPGVDTPAERSGYHDLLRRAHGEDIVLPDDETYEPDDRRGDAEVDGDSDPSSSQPAPAGMVETGLDENGDSPAADASLGEEIYQAEIEHIRAISSDPRRAALEILSGEFSSAGTGIAGSAYRALKNPPKGKGLIFWSEFISAAGTLWDEAHMDASCRMMEIARASFDVPAIFLARIDASISEAKDLSIIHKAENRFSEGDDDAALQLVRPLRSKSAGVYAKGLDVRARLRKRNRTLALGAGGVLFASMLVLAGLGFSQMRETITTRPDVSLPAFPGTQQYRDLAKVIVEEAAQPVRQAPLSDEPSDILPSEDPVRQEAAAPTQRPIEDSIEPARPQDEPLEVSPQLLASCKTAQMVIDRAKVIVIAEEDSAGAANILAFTKRVGSACAQAGVTRTMIDGASPSSSEETIDTMARNIIAGS